MFYKEYFKQLSAFTGIDEAHIADVNNRIHYNESALDEQHYTKASPLGYLHHRNVDFHRLKDYSTLMMCVYNKVERVLEYGCGPSNTAYVLAKNGISVEAFDYESKVLDFQRYRTQNMPNLDYYNLEVYEVLNDTYDAVVCFEVFEHIQDPRMIIDSLDSKLKPQGLLFTTFSSSAGQLNGDAEHICELSNAQIFNYIMNLGYVPISEVSMDNGSVFPLMTYPLVFRKLS